MPPTSSRRSRRAAARAAQVKSRKKKTNESTTGPSTSAASSSPVQQLHTARMLIASGDVTAATTLLERLVTQHADNPDVHEELALAHMQAGHCEPAEKSFRHAIQLRPDVGFEKYASLAQLLGNSREALALAEKGLLIIQTEISDNVPSERVAELREMEGSANCAIAEIALAIIEESNDPTVANELDTRVESAVLAALAASEEGSSGEIEALCSLANLRLSQGRMVDARETMRRIATAFKDGIQMLESVEENNNALEDRVVTAIQLLPPMEIRIAVGKQLIEVHMWAEAVSVLCSIMWECDFNVEVWYMLAVAYWKLGEIDDARNALESTRAVLHAPDGYDGTLDEEMIDKLYKELSRTSSEDVPNANRMEE